MSNWLYTYDTVTKLQLEITSFCNLKCHGCERTFNYMYTKDHIDTKHMTLSDIRLWFTKETLPGLTKVILSGNIDDPAANPELFDICNYFITEFNINVYVNTNGSIRDKKFWQQLGSLGSKLNVEFALDGLEDTLSIYRKGANFKKVIDNATSFIKAGGSADWKFIDFKHNTHQIDEARKLSKDLGFNNFILIKSARPASADMNTYNKFVEYDRVNCKSIINDNWLFVNYDGVMSPCCYFGYNERSTYDHDNLNYNSIENFFKKSPFLKQVHDSWNTDSCNRRCYIKCKLNLKDVREVVEL